MSNNDLTANDLISLGVNLNLIKNPPESDPLGYHAYVKSFVYFAKAARLTGTLHVAEPMLDDMDTVVEASAIAELYDKYRSRFSITARSVERALIGEAGAKNLLLTDASPPDAISELTHLEPYQEALQSDLVICLKAHLARPAIVMAWALGYDLIRSWVFNDPQRLKDFNAQLRNPQVAKYHDFFTIGEQRVLETCRDAAGALTGFTSKTFRTLHGMLDDRNNFAHANYAQATPEEAAVYVQRMVRIVTSPPFV